MSRSSTEARATGEARRTVIVGVDGSETATEAARDAARLAASSDASLTLVIAHPGIRPRYVQGPGGDCWDVTGESSARGTAHRVAGSLRSMVDRVDIVEGVGKPAEVLVAQAERLDADVIVVGNKRVQGPGRVLGAIATSVLRHAPCDVYIAKTT